MSLSTTLAHPSETQVDKGSSLLQQALAYSLESGSKYAVMCNESDCMLISFQQPEASPNQNTNCNPSDHLHVTVVKNKEDLPPALTGFLAGAMQMETAQVTSTPSKL
ncbi:hypothetical protein GCG54_00012375 [Colletotrichum gloeosporioides]|uniref:Uncharacterized protein n=1 Tax=Colletotrichum gloeosporioides TaxID=474922 RepID=A0A8H4FIE9_COLGL|nr:uncharacterized protein GCG54_00012375 [Colletotrichum gloeosporioides]KAF3802129.1 hypothetical protein GCG54_00012375 [Colletotrichum gloeosporioides]